MLLFKLSNRFYYIKKEKGEREKEKKNSFLCSTCQIFVLNTYMYVCKYICMYVYTFNLYKISVSSILLLLSIYRKGN